MGYYTDKLILVTGASSGIGRALSLRFAGEGAAVALVGRDHGRLNAAVEAAGPKAKGYAFDLTNVDSIEGLLEGIERDFGCPIDVVVHAAGTGTVGRIEDTPVVAMCETVMINLVAAMALCHAIIPRMRLRTRAGKLVFITSGVASFGVPGEAAYSASKAGLERISESLRIELAGSMVSVCVVSPGPVDTQLIRNTRRYGNISLVARPSVALSPDVAAAKIVERLASGVSRIELSFRGPIVRHLSYWAPQLLSRFLAREARTQS